jgi:hypothetical protein
VRDVGVNGRVILKYILQKLDEQDRTGSVWNLVADVSEYYDITSGPT